LLGRSSEIQKAAAELQIPLDGAVIIDPVTSPRRQDYVREFYRLRQRRGVSQASAEEAMNKRSIFGSMMVRMGDADGVVSGVTKNYPDTIRPALQVIGVREGIHKVCGVYIVITRKGELYFLADATVNVEPTAEDLAEIALCAAQEARRFEITPRVAMLSFSNFGSTKHPLCDKVRKAVELVRYADPDLIIDGEVQADVALSPKKLEMFPFSTLKEGANVLVFPDLQSCNIACKLLARIGNSEVVGPILSGMAKPVHLLQRGAEVEDIVNMATIAVVEAQDSSSPIVNRAAATATAGD
jgi:malate dehydrogenase (oxaloacetate-decarboxylating)(NADP+)